MVVIFERGFGRETGDSGVSVRRQWITDAVADGPVGIYTEVRSFCVPPERLIFFFNK